MDPNASSRLRRKLIAQPNQEIERLLRRASVQLDFARAFEPDAPEVAEATRIYESEPADLAKWVAQIEAALAPVGARAKEYTIHLVGHGHIDMNWMWSWPETVSATHDTFASVISLMDQYPDLTYTQSQVAVYALTEKYHPALFERIKQRVKEGRWEVSAVHWVEGDKNISSGESIARHLLYSRRYLQEKFGLSPEDCPVDWEPDTFGHANTIPSILAQGSVKYYYSCRTGGGHHHPRVGEERPPVFWWQGPDGARILVNRETTWYNSYVNIGDNFALPMVNFARQTGLKNWLDVFGVGNHGGGPTRDEIDWFLEAREFPCYPTVKFSTAKAYFEAIEKEIADGTDVPVIDHELNYEFTGCYTSQSAIKKANRYGENYCEEAETLMTLNPLAFSARGKDINADQPTRDGKGEGEGGEGLREAKGQIQTAWLNVLFNQFHDILPGSGVAATRDHALGLFQETGAITGAIKREALKNLVESIDTLSLLPDTPEGREERARQQPATGAEFECGVGQGAGLSGFSVAGTSGRKHRFFPVVVYNPCAWERSEIVEVNLWDHDLDASRIVALDENGRAAPTLVTYRSANRWSDWQHHKTTLLFPAENIPALGYKTFLLCEGAASPDVPTVSNSEETTFGTPHLSVQFDRYGAGIKALRLSNGEEVGSYQSDFLAWWFLNESPRGMTSWVLGGLKSESSLPSTGFSIIGTQRNEGTDAPGGNQAAYVITRSLEVPGTDSTVRLKAIVGGLSPRIDFEAEIDWREIGSQRRGIPGLYVEAFDNASDGPVRFETPFGTVAREAESDRLEVPTLRYTHFGGGRLTLLQDSKYGNGLLGNSAQMRIVRSSFDPDHAPEVAKSTVRYSVVFHETPPTVAEQTRLGAAWNHPLIVVPTGIQNGNEPASKSYIQVTTENVVLSSLKLSEQGNGIVLRLVNYADEAVTAELSLHEDLVAGRTQAHNVDLLERPVEGDANLDGNRLTASIPANSFISIEILP